MILSASKYYCVGERDIFHHRHRSTHPSHRAHQETLIRRHTFIFHGTTTDDRPREIAAGRPASLQRNLTHKKTPHPRTLP